MTQFDESHALESTPQYQETYAAAIHSQGSTHEKKVKPWPEAEPLFRPIPPGELYPTDALGRILGGATRATQEIIQSPDAVCAQSILAAATLAVQGHVDIEIDGRVYPTSDFFLSVAQSGDRKTATDKVALAPHEKWQRNLQCAYQDKIAEYAADYSAWRRARDEILSSKAYPTRETKKQALMELGPEPERPIDPIFRAQDPTCEGIVKGFIYGLPSQGVFSDEGGRFLGGYGMNADNQLKTIATLSNFWDGAPINRSRGGDGNILLFGRRLSLHLYGAAGGCDSPVRQYVTDGPRLSVPVFGCLSSEHDWLSALQRK
ncbi:MAG: DUF3987 domain-containing protein [Candidatus Binatia bacterium]